ncbi:MAG: HIT domain-containing protein, partial [Candidatus Schekmanbacteria bacterium]
NKYPYNNGHIMIAPYRHINDITALTNEEYCEMFNLLKKVIKTLNNIMKPDGYNIGFNLGKTAGAGFDEHLHLHIVPRWNGDTNFMPVIADVKVMPEYIEKTYQKIIEEIKKL